MIVSAAVHAENSSIREERVLARGNREAAERGERRCRLDDGVERRLQRTRDVGEASVDPLDLVASEQAEASFACIVTLAGRGDHVDLGRMGGDQKAADGAKTDRRVAAAERLPSGPSRECQLELPPAVAPADPDQAEVSDARPSRLLLTLEVDDGMTAIHRRESDCRTDHATAHHDQATHGWAS
jgi:hypothetical protein